MTYLLSGIAQSAAVVLSLISALIGLDMLKICVKRKDLQAWPWIIMGLFLFAFEEFLGALKTFQIYTSTILIYLIPAVIILFLAAALIVENGIVRGIKW